ncbi:MAG: SDR family oxidoreductase, partial [Rhodospirillales bacterium]|nr:SDR family oxidoreductase [Rhodospirillales bacterium]
GLVGLTRTVALEVGDFGITVNAICPGFIQGRWMRGALGDERYEAMVKNMEETSPVQKASTPEEIADLLVFFITGTDLMTGEILEVDFGLKFGPLPKKG